MGILQSFNMSYSIIPSALRDPIETPKSPIASFRPQCHCREPFRREIALEVKPGLRRLQPIGKKPLLLFSEQHRTSLIEV